MSLTDNLMVSFGIFSQRAEFLLSSLISSSPVVAINLILMLTHKCALWVEFHVHFTPDVI